MKGFCREKNSITPLSNRFILYPLYSENNVGYLVNQNGKSIFKGNPRDFLPLFLSVELETLSLQSSSSSSAAFAIVFGRQFIRSEFPKRCAFSSFPSFVKISKIGITSHTHTNIALVDILLITSLESFPFVIFYILWRYTLLKLLLRGVF